VEAFLVSAGLVAIAEIGDKTQLLAMLLASRYRRPLSILAGILVATLVNHALAAWAGALLAAWLTPAVLTWVLAASFLAMAVWALIPDKPDEDAPAPGRFGAFLATAVAFFIVEMGDKTQIATIALGARFADPWIVAAGTTVGMLLANAPAVFLGGALAGAIPARLVRLVAAGLFAALGVLALLQALRITHFGMN
jgi:putative Ca2+/H+ antiporter (TMEM165/GDT1 family)